LASPAATDAGTRGRLRLAETGRNAAPVRRVRYQSTSRPG
jgi:hypothetical protein